MMIERISDWLKHLPKCSRLESPTELSDICHTIPLSRSNCFIPVECRKVEKKTELYLTWYAKDSFFECYHKKGSALLDKPWKSMLISPHETRNLLYLVFVDMCTLQHKIVNIRDKKSWKNACYKMLEKEYRPAKLFTNYKHPFNTRDFEYFAQSCGYVMCGWNSHKFLQKQIQYFKESHEHVSKVTHILSHSRTVDHDLRVLEYFVSRNRTPEEETESSESDQTEFEEDEEENLQAENIEEIETHISKVDKSETASFENTTTDGINLNKNFENSLHYNEVFSDVYSRKSKSIDTQYKTEKSIQTDSMVKMIKESNTTIPLSCSILTSHVVYESKRTKNFGNSLQSNECLSDQNSRKNKSRDTKYKTEKSVQTDSIKKNVKESSSTIPLSCSMGTSKSHASRENKRIKKRLSKPDYKKRIKENKSTVGQKWECILLDMTKKDDMFYFIFMDADSCYPQVMESENCDDSSCIDACKRVFEGHRIKEVHVPACKPFKSVQLKKYLEMKGITYYFNSPHLQYLKHPRAAISCIKRIISRNYSYEKRSEVLSEFVRKKIIMRNIIRSRKQPITDTFWKGKRVLVVEMTNNEGDYLILVDLENALVEAYPKKPNGRFIFPQEMIVILVEAFNDLGVPKELHTVGGILFESPEFNRLVEYCHVRHCSNCWHVEEGTSYFKILDQVKCCFARTSDVEDGIQLWESLRKRFGIYKKAKQKRKANQTKKYSKIHKKNMYKPYKNGSEPHLITCAIRQVLSKARKNKDKSRELLLKKKLTGNNNSLRDLYKRNKLGNLKSHINREKHSGRTDGHKYRNMLNQILKPTKTRLDSFGKHNNTMKKRNTHSYEKLKKNQSKCITKYKKSHGFKLCGYTY